LKTAGCSEAQTCDLTDDSSKPLFPKRLFNKRQNLLIATGLDINHAIGVKTRRCETRRKEVTARQAPNNGSFKAGCNPGREQRSRSSKFRSRTGLNDFMQGSQCQALVGQVSIKSINPKRQSWPVAFIAFHPLNLLSQIGNSYLLPGTHAPCPIFVSRCVDVPILFL
jgi:hypothetical protein